MCREEKEVDLLEVERAIGYSFHEGLLLREALTHRSHKAENTSSPAGDNGRLSHIGDAVISLIVSDHLFGKYRDLQAGGISIARAAVVSGSSLALAAGRLGLRRYMYLGRGEILSGGREKESILASIFEAVTGAIYLDGGLDAARTFVLNQLEEDIDKAVSLL
ncbi:MAG: ribonuclease III domain-containing protein [Candidatus Tritonobacter lacicola]|nr:ribonuclease III domain-containing protein [Candidatus Tritonobacter lacicola]